MYTVNKRIKNIVKLRVLSVLGCVLKQKFICEQLKLFTGEVEKMENKLTDNEIIKALESLLDRMRAYESLQASIGKGLVEDIISMYNRQKAEIERLQKSLDNMTDALVKTDEVCRKAKSEAYREFAAELYNNLRQYENYDTHHTYEILDRIESVEEFLLNKLVELTRNLHGTCTEK